jgi:hypothetical protein
MVAKATRLAVTVALLVASCSSGTAIDEVNAGDCFDDPDSSVVSELELIDCTQPHDNEVFAELTMTGTAFPGDDAIAEFGIQGCLDSFEPYTGEPYADSLLDYTYIGPTEDGWDNAGDRTVLCILYSADLSKLTASAKS